MTQACIFWEVKVYVCYSRQPYPQAQQVRNVRCVTCLVGFSEDVSSTDVVTKECLLVSLGHAFGADSEGLHDRKGLRDMKWPRWYSMIYRFVFRATPMTCSRLLYSRALEALSPGGVILNINVKN